MFRKFLRFFNIFRLFKKKADSQASALPASKDEETPATSEASAPVTRSATPLPPVPLEPSTPTDSTVPSAQESPSRRDLPGQPKRNQPTSIRNLSQVLNVLRAYVVTFGQPESDLDLRATIGAIVANLTTVQIENAQLEKFTDEAIAASKSLGIDPTLVDVSAQLIAEQVAVWRREQEATVSNVVSAYLQQFAPDDADWQKTGEVVSLVQTVVATLNDGSLSRSGGRALVNKVVETFELDRALGRWVAPEWVALAQKVASYASKGELQSEVRAIAWAYIQQFQATLSPQLIEQITETGPLNLSPAEVLSGDLGDFSEMLFYKFQLLEADPVVTKSHEQIAVEVNQAIADFNAQREPGVDVTEGVKTGDLEVSSPFVRTPARREP